MTNTFRKDFRETVAQMIAENGQAFDESIETWGDSRGQRDVNAEKHMKFCSPERMTGYEEDYVWVISDEGGRGKNTGVRAFITCKCEAVDHVSFIVAMPEPSSATCHPSGLATMLSWLLEDE